nr:uncharacterized protein LOC113691498 isoform X3 [Coffea arabica]
MSWRSHQALFILFTLSLMKKNKGLRTQKLEFVIKGSTICSDLGPGFIPHAQLFQVSISPTPLRSGTTLLYCWYITADFGMRCYANDNTKN